MFFPQAQRKATLVIKHRHKRESVSLYHCYLRDRLSTAFDTDNNNDSRSWYLSYVGIYVNQEGAFIIILSIKDELSRFITIG